MLGEKPERDDDSRSVPAKAGEIANSASGAGVPRDICLLGYAEETRDLVFELPETTEIWAINMAHVFIFGAGGPKTRARAKYWFQMHPRNWSAAGKTPTGYFGRQFQGLFTPTFNQFLGALGDQIRSGEEPSLTFNQFLTEQFDPRRALLQLPGRRGDVAAGGTFFRFNP